MRWSLLCIQRVAKTAQRAFSAQQWFLRPSPFRRKDFLYIDPNYSRAFSAQQWFLRPSPFRRKDFLYIDPNYSQSRKIKENQTVKQELTETNFSSCSSFLCRVSRARSRLSPPLFLSLVCCLLFSLSAMVRC